MPIFSASSSSCLSLCAARSLASLSSFAVTIEAFFFCSSSASYVISLSRGQMWERTVDGLRWYDEMSWSIIEV